MVKGCNIENELNVEPANFFFFLFDNRLSAESNLSSSSNIYFAGKFIRQSLFK